MSAELNIVPREPTPEMISAAHLAIQRKDDHIEWSVAAMWRAMYDAAPPAAPAAGLSQMEYDALVRDAMLWRSRNAAPASDLCARLRRFAELDGKLRSMAGYEPTENEGVEWEKLDLNAGEREYEAAAEIERLRMENGELLANHHRIYWSAQRGWKP